MQGIQAHPDVGCTPILCSSLLTIQSSHCLNHHFYKWLSHLNYTALPSHSASREPFQWTLRHFLFTIRPFMSNSQVLIQCRFSLHKLPPLSSGYSLDNSTISFSFRMRNRRKQNTDEVLGVWNQTDLDSHPNSIPCLLCDLSQVTEPLKASAVLFVKLLE